MIEISGVALREGASSDPSSKYYPSEELEASANQLIGCPVYQQGERTVNGTIGKVSTAQYRRGELVFNAEIFDKEFAKKIQSGDADVRALGRHKKDLEKNSDGQRIVTGLELFALSVKEIETDIEAAQLATTDKRTPPPTATMDAYDSESTPFALSAEIDENMTESITVDETTHSQLIEIRSNVNELDENTPLNDVIAYCAAEAGAPTDEQIKEEQSRLARKHGRGNEPSGGESNEEQLSGDEKRTVESEQERLRDKMFGNDE